MNFTQEKEMLYNMLSDISAERNRLIAMQNQILEKINEIDRIEALEREESLRTKRIQNDIEEEKLKQLKAQTEKLEERPAQEVQKEEQIEYDENEEYLAFVENKYEEDIKDVEEQFNQSEQQTMLEEPDANIDNRAEEEKKAEAIQELKEIIDKHNEEFGAPDINKDVIPKHEIERAKDSLPRKKGLLNIDKVFGDIAMILKEHDGQMHVKDILIKINEISDIEVTLNNLRNNIMPRLMKSNKNVVRVARGMYSFKGK